MNAYKVLQVDREAEQEVIDAAYRRLAAKYHPDKDPSPTATARMQEINAAYEQLRDPKRRGEYDRTREEKREAKRRQEERPSPVPPRQRQQQQGVDEDERASPVPPRSARGPDFPVEEVSNQVFKKVLWLVAIIALLVYFPWGLAGLAAIWGTVWAIKKHPGAVANVVKVVVGLAVATGLYVWRQDSDARERRENELRGLSIDTLLKERLIQFRDSCVRTASAKTPEIADEWCLCLAAELNSRFDASPIVADSAWDYKSQFSRRFEDANPDASTRSACLASVRPAATAAVPKGPPGLRVGTQPTGKATRAKTTAPQAGQVGPITTPEELLRQIEAGQR